MREHNKNSTAQGMTICVINNDVAGISVSAEEAKQLAARTRKQLEARIERNVHLTLADSNGVNIQIS